MLFLYIQQLSSVVRCCGRGVVFPLGDSGCCWVDKSVHSGGKCSQGSVACKQLLILWDAAGNVSEASRSFLISLLMLPCTPVVRWKDLVHRGSKCWEIRFH